MVRGRNTKGMVVLLLLLIATSINATPKISNCDKAFARQRLYPKPYLHAPAALETDRPFELYNVSRIAIGEEFHKPSVNFEDSPSPIYGVQSLPAVPRAAPVILSGIFHISPVHNLRLVAFMILLWAAHTGFSRLPQMASPVRCNKSSRQFSHLYATGVNKSERSSSSFSFKTSKYKGLLYFSFDINPRERNFLLPAPLFLPERTPRYLEAPSERSTQTKHCIVSSKLTLEEPSNCPTQLIAYLLSQTKPFVSFSTESISAHLARGPPALV